ncbi:MAG: response regulator [Ignavibacteriae bacterium]|nr:response regulator [Ignavibacteriota bacterium]
MTAPGARPQLLVVDDEFGMREGISRIFAMEGFDVAVAENGTEGIERGLARDFDIVLLDLKMPDIDGLAVLRTLREQRPDTEYLMMTAFAGIDSAVEATRTGAYTYIPKPFTPDQIVFEVRRALEKRRLTLEARELRAEQERRLLEIHLEQSRLRTIINAISDAVFVTNLQDEIVLANPRARALFELSSRVKAGARIADIFPEPVVELIRDAASKAPEGVELVSREWEMKPGLELVLSMKTVPLRDAGQSIIGYVTTVQDVTEPKRLEMQKSQFVSMVAHELKAPLAAISGYLDTMKDKLLGPDLGTYDTMVHRSSERLKALVELINDLLNISRMELGTARREIAAVSIPDLTAQVEELLRQQMQARGLRFETRFDDGLPPIEVDREEFARVLTNLLSNAIKYNREGGDIVIGATASDGSVLLTVRDTGIGMRPAEVENLFRQFYRAKNELTRAIPGTGLGLSIVKQIVESYHGNVTVHSVFGEGTEFRLRIPVHVVERAD